MHSVKKRTNAYANMHNLPADSAVIQGNKWHYKRRRIPPEGWRTFVPPV